MPSPFPIAPLLGASIYLARHAPHAAAARAALSSAIRTALGDEPLRITAGPDSLRMNDETIDLEVPGATLLNEQMLLYGIRFVELPANVGDADLLRLATALAAFPGVYATFHDVRAALGPSAARLGLLQTTEELDAYLGAAFRSAPEADSTLGADVMPLDIQRHGAEAIQLQGRADAEDPPELTGGVPTRPRPPLGSILQRGRRAIEREDWNGLLDAALELVDAEDQSPSDRAGMVYRIELKRLISRDHLGRIARLAPGERKQEAITLLRRFGSDSTEILVELLVGAMSLGERRGYYTAITQMGEGTDAIVQQLGHPEWYVVRNAAELCGDMAVVAAVPALGRQVQHRDDRVRKSVAGALARIASPTALEWLRKTFEDDSPAVRKQALSHLPGAPAQALSAAIGTLLQRETDGEVQREALLALGRIGSADAVRVLTEWAAPGGKGSAGRSLPLRMVAVKGLAMAGPPSVDALSRLTQDEVAEVRTAAAAALEAMRR